MYKAIIVDDEDIVRNGIKKHFDWQSYNIQIVGDFPDGKKAINYIESNLIDLIVTDVCMPLIDGIELSKKAARLNPATKVIFISGHAEVDYLKDALKIGAADYILKPINDYELSAAVSRVVNIMEQERNLQTEIKIMEERLEKSARFLQERFLITLLNEETSNIENLMERISYLDIPLNNYDNYCIIVIKVENWNENCNSGIKQRSIQIRNDCTEILKKYGSNIFFENKQGEYVAIYNAIESDFETNLLHVAEEMQYRFENEYGLDVSIGISEVFSGIDQIKNAYNDAVDSIKKRYFLSENSNISVKKYEDADSSDIYKWAKNIVYEAILSGDTTQVRNMANRLFSAASTLPNVNEQQNFLIYLLLLPFNLLSNIKNDDDNSRLTVGEVLTEFLCCSKPEEKEKFILKIYEKIMDLMSQKKETRSGIIIRHVKNTIKNKYMEQISVASIAETVNLTPTYLN